MGGACSAYGREERSIQVIGGTLSEREHMGDPDLFWRIILVFRLIFINLDMGV
jgi:hypothetical protein